MNPIIRIFETQYDAAESFAEEICATAVHPVTGQKRITFTGSLINNSKRIAFFVTGGEKAAVVLSILREREEAKNYPAAYIRPSEGILEWFLDRPAAELL